MRLTARLDGEPLRSWHVQLLRELATRVDALHVSWVDSDPELQRKSRSAERLLAWERLLHHPDAALAERADPRSLAQYATPGVEHGVVLDLTHRPITGPGVWRVEYDGQAGDSAAVSAVLAGRAPLVSIVGPSGEALATGRPGSEFPGLAVKALADLAAGVITMVLAVVDAHPLATPATLAGFEPSPRRSVTGRAARGLVGLAVRTGYRSLFRTPHWKVGWRYVEGPDVLDTLSHPDTGWRELADDGHHFYADPFPVYRDGRHHLFVEDFDHRVGRGVISAVEFGPDGPLGTPREVLTHDVHLSYPCVVEDDGEMWMVPETSGAGTIELYRARRYPDDWVRERVLLDGLEASDATPFRHEGRWWMSATVRHRGSFSDSLHLWHAPALTGPWEPHAHNPVLVDVGSARPAGHVVLRGDRLLRPVQDGRQSYGAALAVMEVTALAEDGFDQRLVGQLAPAEAWPGRRLHTLNRAGALECIDGSRLSPRLPVLHSTA